MSLFKEKETVIVVKSSKDIFNSTNIPFDLSFVKIRPDLEWKDVVTEFEKKYMELNDLYYWISFGLNKSTCAGL